MFGAGRDCICDVIGEEKLQVVVLGIRVDQVTQPSL